MEKKLAVSNLYSCLTCVSTTEEDLPLVTIKGCTPKTNGRLYNWHKFCLHSFYTQNLSTIESHRLVPLCVRAALPCFMVHFFRQWYHQKPLIFLWTPLFSLSWCGFSCLSWFCMEQWNNTHAPEHFCWLNTKFCNRRPWCHHLLQVKKQKG